MPVTIVAIIPPKVGKTDRVMQLLADFSSWVKDNEPDTTQYQAYRELKPSKEGTMDVVMVETYKDKAAFAAHGSSDKFKELQKALADEGLIRAKTVLKIVEEKAGYAARL